MRTRKVLVVEDRETHALAARALLEQHGYAVRIAADGVAGIAEAKRWVPDAILMDVSMPGMDGLEAATEIRRDPRTRRIPVIGTTARAEPADFARGILAGFTKYLTKPLSREQLLESLEELLCARERRSSPRLALDTEDLNAFAAGGDRDQIFLDLLRGVRRRVDCDLLAMRWQEQGAPQVLLTLAQPIDRSCSSLLGELGPDLGLGDEPSPLLRVVCAPSNGQVVAPLPRAVRARMLLPLTLGAESVGILVLASFSRDAFEPADHETMNDLSVTLARICARGLRVSEPEGGVASGPGEPEDIAVGVLLSEATSTSNWQDRIEASLPGLRVHALDARELAATPTDLHLVLVSPDARELAEELMHARARAGLQTFPLLDLLAADVEGSAQMLRALLLMGLLVGFGDGRRSGCLHLLADDGTDGGVIVFHEGRVAWASREASDTSLLRRLAERTNAPRAAFAGAVRRAMEEHLSLGDALERDGVVDAATWRAVLRDYLATLVRELLRIPRPTVSASTRIHAAQHNVSFDVGELALGMFDA